MSSADTVSTLFEHAIELERSAETLYRKIGQMFAAHADLLAFWDHFADEENGHAMYLERIQGKLNAEELAAPASDVMLKRAKQCLKDASEIKLNDIQTLDDAYELATELENSETNAIFEFVITTFSTDELAKSHKFLRTQLVDHVAKLETDFPPQYKSRVARQGVQAVQIS